MNRIVALVFLISLGMLTSPAWASTNVVIETSMGVVQVALDAERCPKNVAAFLKRVETHVYRASSFYQVGDTYIQGGKPGKFAPGHSSSGNMSCDRGAPAEFGLKHTRGALIMERTVGACNPGKVSNSTQFSLYFADTPQNDREYTVIGYVSEGLDVIERVAAFLKTPEGKKTGVEISNVRLE